MIFNKFYIAIIYLFVSFSLQAQDSVSLFKLKGQADAFAAMNFTNPIQSQAGLRLLPVLSIAKGFANNLKLDAEISVDGYLNYHFTGTKSDQDNSKIKPYRLWLRLSSERFELRAGLQKINFGSATMLRPLMWFDRMDPRDPLQLTDGVYALLGRYYFQNNANAWLWMLWGNDKTKGWETVPTSSKSPEYGGRMQIPVPLGEAAISFHHRNADLSGIIPAAILTGSPKYNEDKLGLDGKWDLGIGLWAEYSLTHSSLDTAYFHEWTKLFTLGIDYTFSLGNGLNVATEFFRYSNSTKIFKPELNNAFSLFSANYPIGINSRISGILYYNWTNQDWYRILNFQRQSDDWTFYLFLFWNPRTISIYNNGNESNMFAGKGIQVMVVYNF